MTMTEPPRLDPTDFAIIEALQENGRLSVSELGRKVGLSQPATSERLKRLEETGVIAGYTARIDPAALGLHMLAVIRLKTTHEFIRPCLDQFATMPQVIEVLRLTGEDCFLLKVVVPTAGDLELIVDSVAKYGAVTTSLVLSRGPTKPISRELLKRPANGPIRRPRKR
jgi:Lrp/AsnC family transcriptional regulator, leucine-responsive regulatory protein